MVGKTSPHEAGTTRMWHVNVPRIKERLLENYDSFKIHRKHVMMYTATILHNYWSQ